MDVKPRRLRDWWTEGLLPQPLSRGRGRGQGKVFGWHEPNIVDRAAAVCELKRKRQRFKNAHFLELFVLGYSVKWRELRIGVLSFLNYIEKSALHGRSDPDDIENALSRLSTPVSKAQSSQTGLLQADVDDLLRECLLAVFNHSARFDFDLDDLAHTASRWMHFNTPKHLDLSDIEPEMLGHLFTWLQSNFSIEGLREVATAREAEFQTAHQLWGTVQKLGVQFVQKSRGVDATELQALGTRLSLIGSGLIVIALLWICQRGFEQHVQAFAKVFSEHLDVIDSIASPVLIKDNG